MAGEGKGKFARWWVLVAYAVAMAYLESAVVLYLRTLGQRLDPYQAPPLPPTVDFGWVEVVREAATMVMLATAGWMSGSCARTRFGGFLVAFGIWDIFYYIFLVPLSGWPRSPADWDLLFLIPFPWWGPVWAPVSIALLMVVYGSLLNLGRQRLPEGAAGWLAGLSFAAGIGLALWAFMADAIASTVAGKGREAWLETLPVSFAWHWFLLGWLLLAAPVAWTAWRVLRGETGAPALRRRRLG